MNKIISFGLMLIFLISPWWKGSKETIPFALISIFALGLFIYHLKLSYRNKTIPILKERIWPPLIIFYLLAIISTFHSIYLGNSLELLFRLVIYLVLFYLLNVYLNEKFAFFFYYSLIFICFIQGLVALFQFILGQPYLGTFTNPNHLAGYLVCGFVSAWNYLLFYQSGKFRRIVLLILSLFFLFVIFLSHSRSALISLILVSSLIIYLKFSWRGLAGIIIFLLLFFIALPKQQVAATLKLGRDSSYRLKIWRSAVEMTGEHPFLGWGLGNFEYGFNKYSYPREDRIARYGQYTRFAHNEFLQIAAELGLPCLIFFLGAVFILTRKIFENIEINVIAGANILAILLQAFFDFNLHLPAIALVLVFSAAIVLSPWKGGRTVIGFTMPKLVIVSFIIVISIYWLVRLLCSDSFYQKAAQLNPADFYNHQKSGNLYGLLGGEENFRLALKEYKLALTYNPKDVFSLNGLGKLFLRKKEYLRAEHFFKQAIILEPNYLDCYFNLGNIYKEQGEYAKAINYYRDILRLKKILDKMTPASGYEKSLITYPDESELGSSGLPISKRLSK